VGAEEITELLTVMFYRALFLDNPPPERLNYTNNLVGMIRTGHD
jgi:hypothetical protein